MKEILLLPPLDPNQRYTIAETNAYLRQSRNKTYEDIKDGLLTPIKDRRRSYIPGSQIIARSRLDASAAEPSTKEAVTV